MSREIKFRAWDIAQGKMIWFNGYEQWGFIDSSYSNSATSVGMNRLMISNDPDLFAWMQFTGLVDKKESELYADDIIDISRHGETTRHRIIWEQGGWQLNPSGPFPTQYLGCFNSEIIEKKGNIYENKELLP